MEKILRFILWVFGLVQCNDCGDWCWRWPRWRRDLGQVSFGDWVCWPCYDWFMAAESYAGENFEEEDYHYYLDGVEY